MIRYLLLALTLFFLGPKNSFACTCASPSTFCEGISFDGQIFAEVIVRGRIVKSNNQGKFLEVDQLLYGETDRSEIVIVPDLCSIFFNDLEEGSEYIVAMNRWEDQYSLVGCIISFLKIKNEVITGKIAPGVNRLDYEEIFNLESCGNAFNKLAIKHNLKVYPNPTAENIRVNNTSNELAFENLELSIFDSIGRKIGTYIKEDGILPNEDWSLNIRDISPGVYFIQITNRLQKTTFKIIKV